PHTMLIRDLLARAQADDKPNGCPRPGRGGPHTSIVMPVARAVTEQSSDGVIDHRQPAPWAMPHVDMSARSGSVAPVRARQSRRSARLGSCRQPCSACTFGAPLIGTLAAFRDRVFRVFGGAPSRAPAATDGRSFAHTSWGHARSR